MLTNQQQLLEDIRSIKNQLSNQITQTSSFVHPSTPFIYPSLLFQTPLQPLQTLQPSQYNQNSKSKIY